jgi:tRNA nucleotidyltransferase/poly(A) polymerase
VIPELKIIQNVAKKYSLSEPRIVGGIPRDYLLHGKKFGFHDIDITTNSEDILRLAVLSSKELNSGVKIFSDGHATIFHKDFSFDFSSRFISESAKKYMVDKFGEINDALIESYSRDFTINSLESNFSLSEIYDPTGMGRGDIEGRIIRPITTAEICLTDDPRRVYRAVKMASKYSLDMDGSIAEFAKRSYKLFSPVYNQEVKSQYITTAINIAIESDGRRTFDNLYQLRLLSAVPLSGGFKDWIIENRMLDLYFKSIDIEHAESNS